LMFVDLEQDHAIIEEYFNFVVSVGHCGHDRGDLTVD
jgi:hypothetical protein